MENNAATAASIPDYADPAEMAVSELRIGDYVTTIPAQSGFRATRVNSAVRAIRDDHGVYTANTHRGGRRFNVASRQLTFASVTGVNVPADFRVIVRQRSPVSAEMAAPVAPARTPAIETAMADAIRDMLANAHGFAAGDIVEFDGDAVEIMSVARRPGHDRHPGRAPHRRPHPRPDPRSKPRTAPATPAGHPAPKTDGEEVIMRRGWIARWLYRCDDCGARRGRRCSWSCSSNWH